MDSKKSVPQMGFEPTTRVVGSNPIWGSDFSDSTFLLEFIFVVVSIIYTYHITNYSKCCGISTYFIIVVLSKK